MKPRAWITFLLAALASAAIWLLTPMLTNKREPWDAEAVFISWRLALLGQLPALSLPDRYGRTMPAPSPANLAMN